MKLVQKHKGYGIYEQTEKEILNRDNGTSCKYLLFSPDEMEQPKALRFPEFEADNIQELIEFVG